MNKIIKNSLMFILSLCFALSLGCFALFGTAKTQVRADGDYNADAFEMEYGAQIKLTGDGMRFIVKMGSNKYEKIVASDDITLSFLIAPKSYFDALTGADAGKYENLSKKIQIDIPDEKIYTNEGYYYANGVIQNLDENNNPALKNGSQYDYEFVATAMIKDQTGATETEYAAFNGGDMANNTRTQYDIIQAAVLNEDKDVGSALMNSETSPYKTWFGKNTHPLRVDTVEKYELYKALVAAGCDFGTCNVNPRTEEENKTLFLFDRELGAKQITSSDASAIAFDADTSYIQGGNGSLKITFNDKNEPVVAYNTLGYTGLDSGKYVVFYAYNDTNADYIDLGLNYTKRFRLDKGEWSMVIWAADGVAANTYIRFYGYNYGASDYSGSTSANLTGNVYFTKAQVLDSSESEIAQMPTSAGENSYTVGNTALKAADWYENGAYNSDSGAFNSETYGKIYYADGALRAHALAPDTQAEGAGNATLYLTLDTPVAFAGNIMYITMKGAEEDYIYAQVFKDGGGHEGSPNGYVDKVYDDGFVRYAFPFFSTWSGSLKSFRLFALRNLKYPHMDEIIIRDITITSISSVAAEKREGYDTDVIGLFDDPIGVTQISAQTSGISARYTREKHIEGETGSLKLSFSNAVEPSAIQISNRYGYTLESGKYVVFYMYNNTNAKRVDIALGTTSRVCVYRGEWTMICYEADAMNNNNFVLRFYGYLFDNSATTYTGNIYFSRVKVLNSDKVKDATADADCKIGKTTFTGGITFFGNGNYGDVGTGRGFDNSPFYRYPYMVDGVLRTIIRSYDDGHTPTTTPMIRFELKDEVQCQDGTALYITMKGADTTDNVVYAQIFCDGSHKGTPSATVVETLADGYYVYKFDLSGFKDEAPITYFRLYPKPHSRCLDSDWWMAEIRISDIEIK